MIHWRLVFLCVIVGDSNGVLIFKEKRLYVSNASSNEIIILLSKHPLYEQMD